MKLGDYLKAINWKKTPMKKLDDDFHTIKKKYVPFIVNKCMSYFPDTIIQSNNMNLNSHLDKEMHYDYLMYSTRSRNRFSKWHRKTVPDDLDLIKEYFGYSNEKACEALKILSRDDIEDIKSEMDTGGQS